jgi:NO-binding membrane sensor protein with MHYT domain
MGLYVEFRAAFISLTVAVAFIGTYGAVAACEQFRIAVCSRVWDARYKHLLLVAVCLGGVCIWGEFYMSMSSFRLHDHTGKVVLKQYNTALCVSSIPIVIILTYIGLFIASTDSYFTRSKKEIVEIFRTSLKSSEAGLPLDMNSFTANITVSTHQPYKIIVGSVFMSIAIVVMRIMGYASIYIPGRVIISNGPIVAHAIVSVIMSAVGFWMYFRLLSLYPSWDSFRLVCAVHGVALFTGVRYVSLAGVTFEYDPTVSMPGDDVSITSTHLIVGVIITTVMTSFLVLVYVLSDLRGSLQRTNTQLRQADRALLALLHRPAAERNLSNTTIATPHTGARHGLFTQSQRHTQAPLEVVNYSRQFLKSVTQRSATQSEIFTHQHRLFYDVDPEQLDLSAGLLAPRAPQEISRQGSRVSGTSETHNVLPCRGSGPKLASIPASPSVRERDKAFEEGDELLEGDSETPSEARAEIRVKPQSSSTRISAEVESATMRKVIISTDEDSFL